MFPLFPQSSSPSSSAVQINDLIRKGQNGLFGLSALKSELMTIPTVPGNQSHHADPGLSPVMLSGFLGMPHEAVAGDSDDYEVDFEEDEDDPDHSFQQFADLVHSSQPIRSFAELVPESPRHPLDTVIRDQPVDEIPLDDALSFVSDMICGLTPPSSGRGPSSSSASSPRSSDSDILRTPRQSPNNRRRPRLGLS
jgi:hypothetical protein